MNLIDLIGWLIVLLIVVFGLPYLLDPEPIFIWWDMRCYRKLVAKLANASSGTKPKTKAILSWYGKAKAIEARRQQWMTQNGYQIGLIEELFSRAGGRLVRVHIPGVRN